MDLIRSADAALEQHALQFVKVRRRAGLIPPEALQGDVIQDRQGMREPSFLKRS